MYYITTPWNDGRVQIIYSPHPDAIPSNEIPEGDGELYYINGELIRVPYNVNLNDPSLLTSPSVAELQESIYMLQSEILSLQEEALNTEIALKEVKDGLHYSSGKEEGI